MLAQISSNNQQSEQKVKFDSLAGIEETAPSSMAAPTQSSTDQTFTQLSEMMM